MSIFTVIFLFSPGGAAAFGTAGQKAMEVRHQTFTKAEIAAMSQVTALIRTSLGEIRLKFFPDAAPNHVDNFIKLAKSGFYDRTVFHRVIPGFMIQGGDPNSKNPRRATHGIGGPSYVLKAEFNDRTHKRGTLSMARKQSPDSAGSQFFICVAGAPHLDRQYTVFGEVISGMDVVDRIVNQPRDRRDNPLERVEVRVRIIEPKPKKKPKPEKKTEPEKKPPVNEPKEPSAAIGNQAAPHKAKDEAEVTKELQKMDVKLKEPAGEEQGQ
jgi:peptidyl-prolyl cis-trans isomerase B (cyclophilin B)